MPIYEYECKACGEKFEVLLSSHDKPVKKCEYCGSTKIQKLVSNCSFQLKGTGWYVTDYANRDKNTGGKKKKKDAEPASSESASTSSAAEKPAEKSSSATENKAA